MKINVNKINEYIAELADGNVEARRKAISGLAQFTGAEWEGSPSSVELVLGALVGAVPRRKASSDAPFRIDYAKMLGNVGARSSAVVPELLRLLKEDPEGAVRTEAARALGRMGEGANAADKALAVVLRDGDGDSLRGEAALALARVSPGSEATKTALSKALRDKSGHVCICAAESLWRVSGEAEQAVPALTAWLRDPRVRGTAAQALYRIGPKAKAAVPLLLASAKDKDRVFRESVVMALMKIDPQAAAKVGVR